MQKKYQSDVERKAAHAERQRARRKAVTEEAQTITVEGQPVTTTVTDQGLSVTDQVQNVTDQRLSVMGPVTDQDTGEILTDVIRTPEDAMSKPLGVIRSVKDAKTFVARFGKLFPEYVAKEDETPEDAIARRDRMHADPRVGDNAIAEAWAFIAQREGVPFDRGSIAAAVQCGKASVTARDVAAARRMLTGAAR